MFIYLFYTEEELPVRALKEWIHMDKVELEKLEWTRDLPAPRRSSTKKVQTRKPGDVVKLSVFAKLIIFFGRTFVSIWLVSR